MWNDVQIRFGSLKTRCDVVGYEFTQIEGEEPTCNELVGIHLFECKLDYFATQAFGQLLFYKEIVERYMNSKHYDAFNKDYYQGIKTFYLKNGRFPHPWESTFWLSNNLDLWLHLALLETGYREEPFFKFVEGSLDTFLKGNVGLLILSRHRKRWKTEEVRESKPISLKRRRGPKPSHQMEPLVADMFYKTRLNCRRFNKEGKANNWCSENNIDLKECEACDWHIPI